MLSYYWKTKHEHGGISMRARDVVQKLSAMHWIERVLLTIITISVVVLITTIGYTVFVVLDSNSEEFKSGESMVINKEIKPAHIIGGPPVAFAVVPSKYYLTIRTEDGIGKIEVLESFYQEVNFESKVRITYKIGKFSKKIYPLRISF